MDESRASNLRDIDILTGSPMGGGDVTMSGAEGTGEQLFVINLCAAMTPIDLNSQSLPGLNQYKLYQVSRMEDGRRRYRLRLGFFTSVSVAEDALASVRARYATAFTSCLCEEDLKHATGYLKCSVKDLERTGRYAVLKSRGDNSGGTTSLRVLTPAVMQQFQAAEARAVESPQRATTPSAKPLTSTTIAAVLPIRAPDAQRSPAAPPPRNMAPNVAPAVERRQPGSPLRAAPAAKAPAPQPPAAEQTQSLKALIMTPENSPKRESLMRRAQAMAPMDAAERAKALPGAAASAFVDVLATGKFKAAQMKGAPTTAKAAPPAAAIAPVARAVPPPTPAAPVARAMTPPAAPAPVARAVTPPAAAPVAPQMRANHKPAIPQSRLEAHIPPAHAPAASVQKKNQPFHVGAGVNIPDSLLTLESGEPQGRPTRISPIVAPAANQAITSDLLRARELAKQSAQWRQDNSGIPTLDTTQTIRTLTKNELEDANSPKWFTVQLALSDHPANLDTMPHLDIFEAYSLYSVAVMEGSGIRHALRLGFFREEVSAEAVTGYLRTFFNEPTIVRIPDAEHDRFIDAPKIGALTKSAVNTVVLDEKHAAKHSSISNTIPTVSAAVDRTASMTKPPRATPAQQSKPMARSAAAPATKRAPVGPAASKKPTPRPGVALDPKQQQLLEEARLLGLTDTAILRVQKNPSLLTRLVGKLGK